MLAAKGLVCLLKNANLIQFPAHSALNSTSLDLVLCVSEWIWTNVEMRMLVNLFDFIMQQDHDHEQASGKQLATRLRGHLRCLKRRDRASRAKQKVGGQLFASRLIIGCTPVNSRIIVADKREALAMACARSILQAAWMHQFSRARRRDVVMLLRKVSSTTI